MAQIIATPAQIVGEAPDAPARPASKWDGLVKWVVSRPDSWRQWRDDNYANDWDTYERLWRGLARTQTVLGFAYLVQMKTAEARGAFDKAIALDQGDPLPRLGLGLSKIRDGRLEEGGRDIEIAASLDPANSLVRSYLGKVYYEEKRFPRDEREYKVAKELDPRDPTPYFYDAILKQTTNRPVEALQEMEKAIALNDNRAVYRSEPLLDPDNASRSASLARIYTDLGFQQLALVEGFKSVNADPSNATFCQQSRSSAQSVSGHIHLIASWTANILDPVRQKSFRFSQKESTPVYE